MTEFGLNLIDCVPALGPELPPLTAPCGYVVGAGGLYVRAEDSRIRALLPVALSQTPLPGLALVQPEAQLLVPLIPCQWLWSIWQSARAALPDEAMYQLVYDDLARNSLGGWACARPRQSADAGHVTFLDFAEASVDLHSHGRLEAFFSYQDDVDDQGLRFYVVIGLLHTLNPVIAARIGVYGHTMRVPARLIFDGLGPFEDTFLEPEELS
jgi:PRTRC genetic system protein A